MLGMLGTVILALGVTVISIVFIFGFKPTEFISDFLYDRQEKKNESLVMKINELASLLRVIKYTMLKKI